MIKVVSILFACSFPGTLSLALLAASCHSSVQVMTTQVSGSSAKRETLEILSVELSHIFKQPQIQNKGKLKRKKKKEN